MTCCLSLFPLIGCSSSRRCAGIMAANAFSDDEQAMHYDVIIDQRVGASVPYAAPPTGHGRVRHLLASTHALCSAANAEPRNYAFQGFLRCGSGCKSIHLSINHLIIG